MSHAFSPLDPAMLVYAAGEGVLSRQLAWVDCKGSYRRHRLRWQLDLKRFAELIAAGEKVPTA